MKAEERLARELHEVDRDEAAALGGRCTDQQHWREFLALARHVLRRERAAVRRARGRTVAWAIGSPVYEFAGQKDTRAIGYDWSFFEEPVNVRMTQAMGKRVARVVAVPRKGGRK